MIEDRTETISVPAKVVEDLYLALRCLVGQVDGLDPDPSIVLRQLLTNANETLARAHVFYTAARAAREGGGNGG